MNASSFRMPVSLLFFAGLLANQACRTTPKSQLKDAVSGTDAALVKALTCDKGDVAYFVMKKVDTEFTAKDFPVEVPKFDDWDARILRLDVCSSGDDLVLKRVLVGYSDYADVVDVTKEAKIEGLKEAVFDGDYSKLEVIAPYINVTKFDEKMPSDLAFYLKGSSKGAALATVVSKVGEKIEYADSKFLNVALVGAFEYMEPGQGTGCNAIADVSGTSKVGTAIIEWKGQSQTGTSGGAAPNLCYIKITDTAKEMGSNRGVAVEIKVDDFKANENYEFASNHHSVCDSFRFKTPYAEYFITSSSGGFGGGNCKRLVTGAPQPAPEGSKFRFVYGAKGVEGLEKNCHHLTRRCEAPN